MWLTCHVCGKSLSRFQTLQNHIRRYHKEEKTSPTTGEETLSTKVEELTSNQIADNETMKIEENGLMSEWTSSENDNSSSDYYRNTPRDEAFDFILKIQRCLDN